MELSVEGDVAEPCLHFHPLNLAEGIGDDSGDIPVSLAQKQLLSIKVGSPFTSATPCGKAAGDIGCLLDGPSPVQAMAQVLVPHQRIHVLQTPLHLKAVTRL